MIHKFEYIKICKHCGFELCIITDEKYKEPAVCKACKEPYSKSKGDPALTTT